ncbi:unnamed protein product [Orchesella dallaii]|uniref:Gustatory receptor n=1 Tax=Orchesella dallaii TaxID=48710 RepID=A0ABP1R0Q5_9HEXA
MVSVSKVCNQIVRSLFHSRKQLANQETSIQSNVIATHLKWHTYLCATSGLSPYSWNSSDQKVIINKRHFQQKRKWIGFIIFFAMFLAMIYETMVFGYGFLEPSAYQDLLTRMLFLALYGGCGLYFIFNESHAHELAALINELTSKCETDPIFGGLNTNAMKLALRLHLISIIIPMGVMTMMVITPKLPPFPTGLTFQLGLDEQWWIAILRVLLTILQMWTLALYVFDGYLILLGTFFSVIGLWTAARSLKIRNTDTKLNNRLHQYRKIQLLACYANACFQKTIFLGFTVIMILGSTLCLAAVITYNSSLKPSILFLLMLFIVNLTGISAIVYKLPGMINLLSKQVIREWKRRVCDMVGRRKLESRILMSCTQIKIKFGELNYFEAGTSLVIVNFQIENTINLILLNH